MKPKKKKRCKDCKKRPVTCETWSRCNRCENEYRKAKIAGVLCRHCLVNQSGPTHRGLCYTCYGNRKIRNLYPTHHNYGGTGRSTKSGRMPEEPTDAVPGSPRKVEVMRERVSKGEHPHHPKDATLNNFVPGREWLGYIGDYVKRRVEVA